MFANLLRTDRRPVLQFGFISQISSNWSYASYGAARTNIEMQLKLYIMNQTSALGLETVLLYITSAPATGIVEWRDIRLYFYENGALVN